MSYDDYLDNLDIVCPICDGTGETLLSVENDECFEKCEHCRGRGKVERPDIAAQKYDENRKDG
jgi:RecJ-like exonuclease